MKHTHHLHPLPLNTSINLYPSQVRRHWDARPICHLCLANCKGSSHFETECHQGRQSCQHNLLVIPWIDSCHSWLTNISASTFNNLTLPHYQWHLTFQVTSDTQLSSSQAFTCGQDCRLWHQWWLCFIMQSKIFSIFITEIVDIIYFCRSWHI